MVQSLAVIGLGYVGLPLAIAASEVGLTVWGLDTNETLVHSLASGKSHVSDMSDARLATALDRGTRFTSDPERLEACDAVVICVPTPLLPDRSPDLAAVRAAAGIVADLIVPGQLVVLESTTYPGTTEEVLVPILEQSGLEAGRDFCVAFSPERVDPGNREFDIRNTPKIVGGLTDKCTNMAVALYGKFVNEVVVARGPREAEMAKLIENTYRHVNIALVNELAQLCDLLEIDIWDSLKCAATKPYGFMPFIPGPGVGGHCIPIDPHYFTHRVRTEIGRSFRLVETADDINSSMPAYVGDRVAQMLNRSGIAMRGAIIALAGVTYKPDVADERESPAPKVCRQLRAWGADVVYIDPYVSSWAVDGIEVPRHATSQLETTLDVNAVVILQWHSDFAPSEFEALAIPILDTRGRISGPLVETL